MPQIMTRAPSLFKRRLHALTLGPANECNGDITSTIVLELNAPKPLQELFTSFPWQECRNDEP